VTQIVITGASGHLGRRVAEIALETWPPDRLILVTRNPAALESFAARGATVRPGDFDAPVELGNALAGGTRMLLISATDLTRRSEQHQTAIRAAADRYVIYTSMLSPEPGNPAVTAESHRLTEQALTASGIGWTVLRNSLYSDYQVPEAARAIATGQLLHNRGAGRIAYVAREDCAAAAAAVLTAPGHERQIYNITGPELYDAVALASLYGALGATNVGPWRSTAEPSSPLLGATPDRDPGDDHARYGATLWPRSADRYARATSRRRRIPSRSSRAAPPERYGRCSWPAGRAVETATAAARSPSRAPATGCLRRSASTRATSCRARPNRT
jgi:NAD(P)H dehydrogenase (quinone)